MVLGTPLIIHLILAYAKPINKLTCNHSHQQVKDNKSMYHLKTIRTFKELDWMTLVKWDNVSKFSEWNKNNLMTGASVSWFSWFLHYTVEWRLIRLNAARAIWSVGFMSRLAITSLIYFLFTATITTSRGITEKTLNSWYLIACWMSSIRDG